MDFVDVGALLTFFPKVRMCWERVVHEVRTNIVSLSQITIFGWRAAYSIVLEKWYAENITDDISISPPPLLLYMISYII